MISRDLDLMHSNFLTHFNSLPSEDQHRGISSTLIADWVSRDIEVVFVIMPLFGFKSFTFSGETYWVKGCEYAEFRKNIEGFLLIFKALSG